MQLKVNCYQLKMYSSRFVSCNPHGNHKEMPTEDSHMEMKKLPKKIKSENTYNI